MVLRAPDGATFELSPTDGGLRVSAVCGWVTAQFTATLSIAEVQRFGDELRAMAAEEAGARSFLAEDNWLALTVVMAKRGELHVSVTLQRPPDYLHELRLFFNLPQAELPRIIQEWSALYAQSA
jgi:hypothetical protein